MAHLILRVRERVVVKKTEMMTFINTISRLWKIKIYVWYQPFTRWLKSADQCKIKCQSWYWLQHQPWSWISTTTTFSSFALKHFPSSDERTSIFWNGSTLYCFWNTSGTLSRWRTKGSAAKSWLRQQRNQTLWLHRVRGETDERMIPRSSCR